MVLDKKKSQHGYVRLALLEHLTPPCYDFACGGLEGGHTYKQTYLIQKVGTYIQTNPLKSEGGDIHTKEPT